MPPSVGLSSGPEPTASPGVVPRFAWEANRRERLETALGRALELLDLTARDDRWRGHRRREILRSREEFCRLFFEDHPPSEAARTLKQYFLHFAVLARRRPG